MTKRRGLRSAALAVFVFIVTGVAFAQAQKDSAEIGFGANSCAAFAAIYKNDPAGAETGFFTWAQGFMSGMNMVLLGREHQRSTDLALWDMERQRQYIRAYCAANPARSYDEGVFDLFAAMRKEQGLPGLAK